MGTGLAVRWTDGKLPKINHCADGRFGLSINGEERLASEVDRELPVTLAISFDQPGAYSLWRLLERHGTLPERHCRGYPFSMTTTIERAYALACERYADSGIDAEAALQRLSTIPISLHCWQGDDVGGFEKAGSGEPGGGLAVTGNYPGKARTPDELREDLEKALSLIPGKHRLNLHACYAELSGGKVERTDYAIQHFQGWIDWCRQHELGFDFNPTFFAHPLAAAGFTLSHRDENVRRYWIEHGKACRRIAANAGRQIGRTVVTNFWIPDGCKDLPADRKAPRERLAAALDEIFAEKIDPAHNLDAVESKLFGIGSESYVVGSHEFYLGYAITRQKLCCLDAGHFHPTESLADKVSSVLQFVPGLLLHVSRGVRWDSDHVVLLDDATRAVMEEVVRGGFLDRTFIGLDFFDASINRVAAWVIGARNALKALLIALLEPVAKLRELELANDLTARLAMLEELKSLPFAAVWDEHCRRQNVPVGAAWLDEVRDYERTVLSKRA
jgi:L-rhamnose isomerase